MTAFAAVLLVIAAAVVVGLVIAITWAHFDLLRARNDRLRRETHRLADLVAHVCWERDQALHQLDAERWARDDQQALARHRTAAASEGLHEPLSNGQTDPRMS